MRSRQHLGVGIFLPLTPGLNRAEFMGFEQAHLKLWEKEELNIRLLIFPSYLELQKHIAVLRTCI
jgi:hypothetical protein